VPESSNIVDKSSAGGKLRPAMPKKPRFFFKLLICLLVSLFSRGARAQELMADGDFEGEDLPWVVSAVPNSNVTLVSQNSPFDYPYPVGTTSLELIDDDSEDEFPSLRHTLARPIGGIFFGFDFKAPLAATASRWDIAWEGGGTTAFFFSIGGGEPSISLNNQQKIDSLAPNKWYHLQGYAEAARNTVEGFILGENGDRADFQGQFSVVPTNLLSSVYISDGTPQRSEILLLDNFATRPVSLESTWNDQGQQVISWLGSSNFVLQATSALGTSWTNVPTATTGFTNGLAGQAQFFRLKRP
jgi:hypothetical protein